MDGDAVDRRRRPIIAAKGSHPTADLAQLRQGQLNLHDSLRYAFLPEADIDAMLARLASGPARHRGIRACGGISGGCAKARRITVDLDPPVEAADGAQPLRAGGATCRYSRSPNGVPVGQDRSGQTRMSTPANSASVV